MSNDQLQVKRATRGKALRFNFGASIHRVVAIDLADAAFEPGTTEIRIQWRPRIDLLLDELKKAPAVLRLSYVGDVEDADLVDRRLQAVKEQITTAWEAMNCCYPLTIEPEVFWRLGAPPKQPVVTRPGQQVNGMTRHHTLLLLLALRASCRWRRGAARPCPARRRWANPSSATSRATRRSSNGSRIPHCSDVDRGDRLEKREVVGQAIETVKLRNVVPPIRFESGVAKIPPRLCRQARRSPRQVSASAPTCACISSATRIRNRLSGALARVFEDNAGLSRERAGEVAEYFKTALALAARSDRLRMGRRHPADRVATQRRLAARSTAASKSKSGTTRPATPCAKRKSSSPRTSSASRSAAWRPSASCATRKATRGVPASGISSCRCATRTRPPSVPEDFTSQVRQALDNLQRQAARDGPVHRLHR